MASIQKSHNSTLPPGLQSLYSFCHQLYPNQPNPLQVTARVKYWLGGPDPLDYISMYYNPGNTELMIPPHWHFISFGLSDLHGDGRVHEPTGPGLPSGFGFELTMRVECEDGEKSPPVWPAALMQGLAKYIFQSESSFCAGDHISWHAALDGSESRIQHMLVADDPQLHGQTTPLGEVHFAQIVGVTAEELQAAQHWNGAGVLNIMKKFPETGGLWHVTDMRRGESIFDHDPSITQEVDDGIENHGSNLSGVSAQVVWSMISYEDESHEYSQSERDSYPEEECDPSITHDQSDEIRNALRKGLMHYRNSAHDQTSFSDDEDEATSVRQKDFFSEDSSEMGRVLSLPSLHLSINFESGSLLPLALRGRLKHGRHFTFKSAVGTAAVTFLTPSVEGAFVSPSTPFATKGHWLQVLIDEDVLEHMISELAELANPDQVSLPFIYVSPHKKLRITVLEEL